MLLNLYLDRISSSLILCLRLPRRWINTHMYDAWHCINCERTVKSYTPPHYICDDDGCVTHEKWAVKCWALFWQSSLTARIINDVCVVLYFRIQYMYIFTYECVLSIKCIKSFLINQFPIALRGCSKFLAIIIIH